MSQYQSGGGGGGYLTGGSSFAIGNVSGGGGGGGNGFAASHSIRPVTIKQLHAAQQRKEDAPWTIESVEIGHVALIAQLLSVKVQATNTVYYLDDGTGRIKARRWRDAAMDASVDVYDRIPEDSWVRVTGVLKTYQTERHVNHITIHRISDSNELWYHQLDVIVATLKAEKGLSAAPQVEAASQPAALHHVGGSGSGARDEHANLPPVQKAIVDWITSHRDDPDEGYHIGLVSRHVQASEDDFAQAIEDLMENGTIFTTIDDTHISLAR